MFWSDCAAGKTPQVGMSALLCGKREVYCSKYHFKYNFVKEQTKANVGEMFVSLPVQIDCCYPTPFTYPA